MSRSYKKTPRCGQKKDKYFKRYANRRVRRNKTDLFQHKSYKKDFQTYDICDYEEIAISFSNYWEHCLRLWYTYGQYRRRPWPFPDKGKEYKYWYKHYKRK